MTSLGRAKEADERPCYLSRLPPEIINGIFSDIDAVCTLAHFITTSRFIYQHFEVRKGAIILRVLQNELGPVLTDARFLHGLPCMDPGGMADRPLYWDTIHNKGAIYRDMLSGGFDGRDAVLSCEELTGLCRTLGIMNILTDTYMVAQQHMIGGEGPATMQPSRTERLRVLRSFYRRQIICNAWAPTKRERASWMDQDAAAMSNTSDHQGVRLGLLASFEPWELQQVDHADYFFTRLCVAFRTIGEERAMATPAPPSLAATGTTQPIGEVEFGDTFSHADRLVRCMREHPSLTEAALRALRLIPEVYNQEATGAVPTHIQFIRRFTLLCLRNGWQSFRAHNFPDPVRDQYEQQQSEGNGSGAMVSFVGDKVDSPPFGWVDALDGRYVNWFGDGLCSIPGISPDLETRQEAVQRFIFVEAWRGAGFALWDRRRVEALKEVDSLRSLRTGWILG